jgi:hypothetical protein
MEIISDKNVGLIWQEHLACFADGDCTQVETLIRKLVEERNCRRIGCKIFGEHFHPFGERPSADFGINPDEVNHA